MSPPLRVLYSFPHTIGAPGIGVTALNQVFGLRAAGVEVKVVCTSVSDGIPLPSSVQTLALLGRRIPHRALGGVDRAFAYHDHRVASILNAGDFDVVHTWPLGALATLTAARRAGVLGAREAPNSHTAVAYRAAAEETQRLGLQAEKGQSHYADAGRLARELAEYEAAQMILVPSEHVRQSFLSQEIPESKLARHQYGFDPRIFHARGRLDSPNRAFTAVFLGSAEPRKGLHYALEAWHSSGASVDGQLLIAGRFARGYRELLQPLLNHPSIHVLGFVADTPDLLRSADVLLLPSLEEGSALVTYEAQASGCIPLVSTSAGAPLVDGREGLLHEPRDVGCLASQIRRVQSDADLRERLRAAGIAASSSLTWEAAGSRLLRVFMEGLSRG